MICRAICLGREQSNSMAKTLCQVPSWRSFFFTFNIVEVGRWRALLWAWPLAFSWGVILTVRILKLSCMYLYVRGASFSKRAFISMMRSGSASFTMTAMVVCRLWILMMPFFIPEAFIFFWTLAVISMKSSVVLLVSLIT